MLKMPISELRKIIDTHGETAADELGKTIRGQYVQVVIDEEVSDELVGSFSTWLKEAGAIAIGLKY